uniref:Uncharacterized protein n=1 Tax=Anguilla anguilla TaxID=7936 RepID=A0A0E9RBW7_ANGAN
MTCENVGNK